MEVTTRTAQDKGEKLEETDKVVKGTNDMSKLNKTSSKHLKDSQITKCNLCYKSFYKNSHMRKHFYRYHHHMSEFLHNTVPPEKLNSPCSLCDLKFLDDSLLDDHLKIHYLSDNAESKSELKRAKKSKPNKFKDLTTCQLCQLDYKTEGKLIRHKNSVHSTELEALEKKIKKSDLIYKCCHCPKRYFTQVSLDFHIVRKHNFSFIKKPRAEDNCAPRERTESKKLCSTDPKNSEKLGITGLSSATNHTIGSIFAFLESLKSVQVNSMTKPES